MKIPSILKIGGYDVKIDYDNSTIQFGQFDPQKLSITLFSLNSSQNMSSTLIHEIIEALNYIYELDLPHDKITVLANGMFQVLKDNKLVFN